MQQCLQDTTWISLSKVDVPDSLTQSDPKTWEGPWRSLTDLEEVAKAVCKANTSQYHQATDTPSLPSLFIHTLAYQKPPKVLHPLAKVHNRHCQL